MRIKLGTKNLSLKLSIFFIILTLSLLGVKNAIGAQDTGVGNQTSIRKSNITVEDIGDIIHEIPAPEGDPRGLTWDGSSLWHADNNTGLIYQLNPSNGSVINSFPSPGSGPRQGLAWDGSSLWYAEYNSGTIYQIEPGSGSVIKSMPGPSNYPTGLTWDGSSLWTTSYRDQMIYQFSPSDGHLISSFPPPNSNPWGMAWAPSGLWHGQYDGYPIYQLNPSDGSVITSFSSPAGSWLLGMTWDGAYLWAVDHNAGKIYQIDVGAPPTTGNIEGQVTDYQTGAPIESASVIAIQIPTKVKIFTDGKGYYSFLDLEIGEWWLIGIKAGYRVYIAKVLVKPGETTKHDFTLETR